MGRYVWPALEGCNDFIFVPVFVAGDGAAVVAIFVQKGRSIM